MERREFFGAAIGAAGAALAACSLPDGGPAPLRRIERYDPATGLWARVRMHELRDGDRFRVPDAFANDLRAVSRPRPEDGPAVCSIAAEPLDAGDDFRPIARAG